MKISKLFHWLYAFLMFLPILFLVPTLAYYGFNENAVAQEKTVVIDINYDTNEVSNNNPNDLVQGNVYRYSYDYAGDFLIYCEEIFIINVPSNPTGINTATDDSKYIRSYNRGSFDIALGDGNVYVYQYLVSDSIILDFVFDYYDYAYNIRNTNSCPITHVKEHSNVTYSMSITESVNQSILDTFDLPMFSWTSDNFIIAPFNYITNMFGLPSDNVVNKYLDYWLTISIVYLCFDVIMYVPLLVHRWLDKGIVE